MVVTAPRSVLWLGTAASVLVLAHQKSEPTKRLRRESVQQYREKRPVTARNVDRRCPVDASGR